LFLENPLLSMPKKLTSKAKKKRSKFRYDWLSIGLWTMVLGLFLGNIAVLNSAGTYDYANPEENLRLAAEEDRMAFDKLSFWQKLIGGQILDDDSQASHKSAFDGLAIDPEYEESVVSVMLDNISIARAQHSGIRRASLVYEALVEGGITRLMLLYPYQELERVGPVRSARDYFVSFAEEYGGVFAHIGGSPAALEQLWFSDRLVDMEEDERLEGETYSFRDERYSPPHNSFFKLLSLKERVAELELIIPKARKKWCFSEEWQGEPLSVNKISLDFSNDLWSSSYVQFIYDEEARVYKRFYGQDNPLPHTDQADGLQVSPSNIVVQVLAGLLIEGDEKERLQLNNVGTGLALYYSQGKKLSGSWEKTSQSATTKFFDEDGTELCFSPGQTWVAVIDAEELVGEESEEARK